MYIHLLLSIDLLALFLLHSPYAKRRFFSFEQLLSSVAFLPLSRSATAVLSFFLLISLSAVLTGLGASQRDH